MSFSPEWESWYQTHAPIDGWYPNVIKLLAGWVREADKILELGPGSGGNIEFLLSQRWGYHGIEGSETAVKNLRKRFPQIQLAHADFTKENPFGGGFDVVLDRASLAHNDLPSIRQGIEIAINALKPGGLMICADWFSKNHSESDSVVYHDGQFAGIGHVHFSDEEELIELFKDWDRLFIEERITRRPASGGFVEEHPRRPHISERFDEYWSAVYDFVVRKPYE